MSGYINRSIINSLFELKKSGVISWRDVVVGAALASFIDAEGTCWPSRRKIQDLIGADLRELSRSIRTLEKTGALGRTPRRGKSTKYKFNPGGKSPLVKIPKGEKHPGGKSPPTLGENPQDTLGENPPQKIPMKISRKNTSAHPSDSRVPKKKSKASVKRNTTRIIGNKGASQIAERKPRKKASRRPGARPPEVAASGWTVPAALTGLTLYEADERLCRRWTELFQAWRRAYPDLDIEAELAKAHAWELVRPSKERKKDHPRFLASWLGRAKSPPIDAEAERREREWERKSLAYGATLDGTENDVEWRILQEEARARKAGGDS